MWFRKKKKKYTDAHLDEMFQGLLVENGMFWAELRATEIKCPSCHNMGQLWVKYKALDQKYDLLLKYHNLEPHTTKAKPEVTKLRKKK